MGEEAKPQPPKRRHGLGHWMQRVLGECDRVERSMDEEAVHDLRVALRRCRTMAEALRALDADPAWRRMRKVARRLFQRLGELRDAQVMAGWTRQLAPATDPAGLVLLGILSERERSAKLAAARALENFDRREWKRLSKVLTERARVVPSDGLAFELQALERWQESYALHRMALRSRTPASFHQLRIGLKKFRYVVENFLPRRHAEWGDGLKQIQDVLGEAHDLDVLWQTLPQTGDVFDAEARSRWREWINTAMAERLAAYREKVSGPGKGGLWAVWRAALPDGKRLDRAVEARFIAWARFLDADLVHGQRVARMAVELYDGLRAAGQAPQLPEAIARRLLRIAAVTHDVGRAEVNRGHHKASYRMIRELAPPPGWSAGELEMVALLARYHRGADPRPQHTAFGPLSTVEQEAVRVLAGILRLANALDAGRDGAIAGLVVHVTSDGVVIQLQPSEAAVALAAPLVPPNGLLVERKRLLESALHRPVFLRAAQDFATVS